MSKPETEKIFKQLQPILIVTEDKKSAKNYLECRIKALGLGSSKLAKVEHKDSSPISVVEGAEAFYKAQLHKSKPSGGELPYKKVYCVMDVDNHDSDQTNPDKKSLTKALLKIKLLNNSYPNCEFIPIVSNECFEVWYVLHFKVKGDTKMIRRPSDPKKSNNKNHIDDKERYDKILAKNDIKYNKSSDLGSIIFEHIKDKEQKAIENARWLEDNHNNNDTHLPYCGNPSTEVYKLIEDLIDLSNKNSPQTVIEQAPFSKDDLQYYPYEESFIMELIDKINEFHPNYSKSEKNKMLHLLLIDKNTDNFSEEITSYFWAKHKQYHF